MYLLIEITIRLFKILIEISICVLLLLSLISIIQLGYVGSIYYMYVCVNIYYSKSCR